MHPLEQVCTNISRLTKSVYMDLIVPWRPCWNMLKSPQQHHNWWKVVNIISVIHEHILSHKKICSTTGISIVSTQGEQLLVVEDHIHYAIQLKICHCLSDWWFIGCTKLIYYVTDYHARRKSVLVYIIFDEQDPDLIFTVYISLCQRQDLSTGI